MNIKEIFSFRLLLLPVPKYYLNYDLKDITGELWLPIKGFEGLYEISNLGRVKSLPKRVNNSITSFHITKEKILKQIPHTKIKYLRVNLYKENCKSKGIYLHQCVAEHFILNPESKKEVNHIDGTRDINNVWNLEFTTRKENVLHALRTGLVNKHLSSYVIKAIRDERLSLAEISKKYNICYSRVSRIVRGNFSSYYKECLDTDSIKKKHGNSMFSIEQLAYILKLRDDGKMYKEIAKEMGCNDHTIGLIVRKRTNYSHLY